MDPSTIRILCGLLAIVLLVLVVMRRRKRASR